MNRALHCYHMSIIGSQDTGNLGVISLFNILFRRTKKESIKAPYHWSFVRGILWWQWIPLTKDHWDAALMTVDSPHKGPLRRSFDDSGFPSQRTSETQLWWQWIPLTKDQWDAALVTVDSPHKGPVRCSFGDSGFPSQRAWSSGTPSHWSGRGCKWIESWQLLRPLNNSASCLMCTVAETVSLIPSQCSHVEITRQISHDCCVIHSNGIYVSHRCDIEIN